MKTFFLLAACLGAALTAAPVGAQDGPAARDPRDRYVPNDATGPAAGFKGQPWWAPLAECAAVFRGAGEKETFQKFAGHAMMRVADDRKVKAEEAAALVLPFTEGRGKQRAEMMVANFGLDRVQSNCDALFVQYEAK